MIKTQKGFALIESLLIILILVIIGFGGYYVWHTQKDNNKVTDDTLKAGNSQPTATGSNSNSKNSQTYLIIKEWGVKIKTDSSEGTTYYNFNADAQPANSIAEVFSSAADAVKGPSGTTCKGEYIAWILRLPSTDPNWSDSNANAEGGWSSPKTIGSYSYAVSTHKQYGPDCFNSGTADNYVEDIPTHDKFQAISDQFAKDFDNLQAT